MQKPTSPLLPWLVGLCGIVAAGLLYWSHHDNSALKIPPDFESPAPQATGTTGGPSPSPVSANPSPLASTGSSSAVASAASPAPSSSPTPSPTPLPSDAELAGPLPTKEPETNSSTPLAPPLPEPSASPQLTPAPQVAPTDAATLAQQPQFWPPRITLVVPVKFPVFINGREAGNIQPPGGTVVNLRKVFPDGTVEVEDQGLVTKVPAKSTDLLIRAQAAATSAAAKPPAPP